MNPKVERRLPIKTHPEQYRIYLLGVGTNTEEEKDAFCNQLSEKLGITYTLLRRIVDHCPMPLKKNLTWPKARSLALVLRSFGAQLLVEAKMALPPISLEFQNPGAHLLTLESSSLGRNRSGTWSVTGRARNESSESLSDVWVLIQIFNIRGEFLTFEEIPLVLNPLAPGEVSPFRAVFEEDIPVYKASIGFKSSSGNPLPAVDRRAAQEWVEIKWDEGEELALSINLSIPPRSIPVEKPKEELKMEAADPPSPEQIPIEPEIPEVPSAEPVKEAMPLQEPLPERPEAEPPLIPKEGHSTGPVSLPLPPMPEPMTPQIDSSVFEEASQWIQEITSKKERGEEGASSLPWMDEFRNSIQAFEQSHSDSFAIWFEEQKRQGELKSPFHSLLTVLVHARFNQANDTETALQNTRRVLRVLDRSEVSLDEIPGLEGTLFFSGDQWRDLFYRAFSKLQQVSHGILEKRRWEAGEIERLILVIPHMSDRLSRKAVRWISQLMPESLEVEFSNHPISIDSNFYRVACRLGVVDPHFDFYSGKSSMGNQKIQAFAKAAFPQDPTKIEAPMAWLGKSDAEGHCFPFHQRCEGCPFEAFCPKLYPDFDPAEKGMGRR